MAERAGWDYAYVIRLHCGCKVGHIVHKDECRDVVAGFVAGEIRRGRLVDRLPTAEALAERIEFPCRCQQAIETSRG